MTDRYEARGDVIIDRHEAECARVEAEFNGMEMAEQDALTSRLYRGMMVGEHFDETRRLFDEIAARIKAIEARLDDK